MPDTKFRTRVKVIVPVLSVAVALSFALASWSFYSSFSQACLSRNQTLTVLSDVVDLATTPPAGEKLPREQLMRMAAFRAAVQARIRRARC